MFFYSDVQPRMDKPFRYKDGYANKAYRNHFDNSLTLLFFMKNGTAMEKIQAGNEMKICERKMIYWARHPDFDDHMADLDRTAIKRKWE